MRQIQCMLSTYYLSVQKCHIKYVFNSLLDKIGVGINNFNILNHCDGEHARLSITGRILAEHVTSDLIRKYS